MTRSDREGVSLTVWPNITYITHPDPTSRIVEAAQTTLALLRRDFSEEEALAILHEIFTSKD